MPQFVHLHVHTQYSILDGQASVQRLVDKAMADGQPGIAVTDHGVAQAFPEFWHAGAKCGIKVIYGVEAVSYTHLTLPTKLEV